MGWTLLFGAYSSGIEALVKYLVQEHGDDVNKEDNMVILHYLQHVQVEMKH